MKALTRPDTFKTNDDFRLWRKFYRSLSQDFNGQVPYTISRLTWNAYYSPELDLSDFLYWTPRWYSVSHRTLCLAYALVQTHCPAHLKADCHQRFALVCKHRGF
jgi:hypothetical protein